MTVADEGPGIAAADRDHIFEPFHRADPSRARATGGVGLGLAIVSAIATAHGGTVGVDSEPGSGATFWVRLPLAAVEAPPPVGPPVDLAPPPIPSRRRPLRRRPRGPGHRRCRLHHRRPRHCPRRRPRRGGSAPLRTGSTGPTRFLDRRATGDDPRTY